MTKPERLEAIKNRLGQISTGPWYLNVMGEIVDYKQSHFEDNRVNKNSNEYQPPIYGISCSGLTSFKNSNDGLFLANARDDVEWLAAELDRMIESRNAWREVADKAIDKLVEVELRVEKHLAPK